MPADDRRRDERSTHRADRNREGSSKRSNRHHRDPSPSSSANKQRRDRSASPSSSRRPLLSPTSAPTLPHGATPLTADDYYARSYEFKSYLSARSLFLDELSSSSARKHFDRFVSKWNSGRLDDVYYAGTLRSGGSGSSQTRHQWGLKGLSKGEREVMESVRDTVDTLTNGQSRGAREARDAERHARRDHVPREGEERGERNDRGQQGDRDSGWSQRHSDRQVDREHTREMTRISEADARRRARTDATDEAETLHGRATGRDRMHEKRLEKRESNRAFARRNDDGLELDDRELYDEPSRAGEGGERRLGKRELARQERVEERKAELQERVGEMKRKEGATMDMFRAMAAERFGGSG